MNLRGLSTLQLALLVSLALHAALLTLRFADPERFRRVFEDTPLEVVLVNARTQEQPDKAQAIAQFSMAGGGEADAGRSTTPLPPSALVAPGENEDEQTQSSMQTLQEEQLLMLARVRSQLAALPPPQVAAPGQTGEQRDREEKRRRLVRQLAEIEERIRLENARPKKRYVSPATTEKAYALYYDKLRRAIEEKGTINFPQVNGRKLYGELTMVVTVNYDGSVVGTEIVQSSGNATLDRRAEMIAVSAGPFGPFSREMRAEADQIVVVSRFTFTRDETLEAKVTARQ